MHNIVDNLLLSINVYNNIGKFERVHGDTLSELAYISGDLDAEDIGISYDFNTLEADQSELEDFYDWFETARATIVMTMKKRGYSTVDELDSSSSCVYFGIIVFRKDRPSVEQ